MHLHPFAFLICILSLDVFVPGHCQSSSTTSSNSETMVPALMTETLLIYVERNLVLPTSSLIATKIDDGFGLAAETVLVNGDLGSSFWTVAMDYRRGLIYYTDWSSNYFGVYHFETQLHDRHFEGLAFGIDALAVDWFTGNVYWTDTELNRIMVSDPTFAHTAQIQTINSLIPSKMAVDPLKRSLFWSETQATFCAIYTSDLVGNNPMLLHNFTDTLSIDEMVIDANANRLYWVDRVSNSFLDEGRLRSFSLDSPEDITTHFIMLNAHFHGFAPYQDLLYLSNLQSQQILVYNTSSGSTALHVDVPNVAVGSMVVHHPSSQPWSDTEQQAHPCTGHRCEQICISNGQTSYVCTCTLGYHLQDDGISCGSQLVDDNFALVLDDHLKQIFQVSLDNPESFSALPLMDVGAVQSVEYDYKDKMVYWIDIATAQVFRSFLNGESKETFINGIGAVSLGIDHISRNLYLADIVSSSIVVSSLDFPNVTAILHVENAYTVWKLVVSHTLGKIFWADWGQRDISSFGLLAGTGRIESSNLDGSERTVVANDSIAPLGITVDEQTNTLFWTEVIFSDIRWYNLNSKIGGKFSTSTGIVSEITSHKNYLYFTDVFSSHAHRVLMSDVVSSTRANDTTLQQFGPQIFFGLSGIRIIDSTTVVHTGSSTCSRARESCPQICLPQESDHMCICGYHYEYIAANNTCTQTINFEDDVPPDFGDTCPGNILRSVDRCSNVALVDFPIPTATDESGPVIVKAAQPGSPPFNISRFEAFTYTAVDGSGHTAVCSFFVLVSSEPNCLDFPTLPDEANVNSTSCGSMFGSVIDVSCRGSHVIRFQYECSSSGNWIVIGDPDCSAPDPQLPPTTTAIVETKIDTTIADTTNASLAEREPLDRSSGLSGGVIAAIVIVTILVIIIGVFLIIRYQHTSLIPTPAFWRRGDDSATLDGGSKSDNTKSCNTYEIL